MAAEGASRVLGRPPVEGLGEQKAPMGGRQPADPLREAQIEQKLGDGHVAPGGVVLDPLVDILANREAESPSCRTSLVRFSCTASATRSPIVRIRSGTQ